VFELGWRMLLVELGNTRIKSTLCGESGIGDVFQITHSSPTWQKDFKSYLASLAQPVRVCYIASVASVALTASLEQLVTRNLALQPVEIKAQKDFLGVINGYQAVETLGVDRWLAMIAAYQRFPQGVCVVDSGTATTVDVVDRFGQHRGGLILPGLKLAQNMLQNQTARIEINAEMEKTSPLLADNTSTAVYSGIVHATRALIDLTMREEGNGCALVLTGGAAHEIGMEWTGASISPNLVLEGLYLVAKSCRQN